MAVMDSVASGGPQLRSKRPRVNTEEEHALILCGLATNPVTIKREAGSASNIRSEVMYHTATPNTPVFTTTTTNAFNYHFADLQCKNNSTTTTTKQQQPALSFGNNKTKKKNSGNLCMKQQRSTNARTKTTQLTPTGESNRLKSSQANKTITLEDLRMHFDRPIIEVAQSFGICITLMKKICRRNGIKRWPHRQIRSLSKSIASLEAALSHQAKSHPEREKYLEQIRELHRKRHAVIQDPNNETLARKYGVTVKTKQSNNEMMKLLKGSLPPPPPPPTQRLTTIAAASKSQSQLHEDNICIKNSHNNDVSSAISPPVTTLFPAISHTLSPVSSIVNSSNCSEEDEEDIDAISADVSLLSSTSASIEQAKGGRWNTDEHTRFLEGIKLFGKDWRRVALVVGTRNAVQTRTHAQKYLKKSAGSLPSPCAVSTSVSTPIPSSLFDPFFVRGSSKKRPKVTTNKNARKFPSPSTKSSSLLEYNAGEIYENNCKIEQQSQQSTILLQPIVPQHFSSRPAPVYHEL